MLFCCVVLGRVFSRSVSLLRRCCGTAMVSGVVVYMVPSVAALLLFQSVLNIVLVDNVQCVGACTLMFPPVGVCSSGPRALTLWFWRHPRLSAFYTLHRAMESGFIDIYNAMLWWHIRTLCFWQRPRVRAFMFGSVFRVRLLPLSVGVVLVTHISPSSHDCLVVALVYACVCLGFLSLWRLHTSPRQNIRDFGRPHDCLSVVRRVLTYRYGTNFWARTGFTLSCWGLSLISVWAVWVDFAADLARQRRRI